MNTKSERHLKRKKRVSFGVSGTKERPRLSVFRSNAHIYGQLLDDEKGVTLASISDLKVSTQGGSASGRKKVDLAAAAGEELGKLALAKKIKVVVFDRNGFKYHGRIKAFADGARKGGLKF